MSIDVSKLGHIVLRVRDLDRSLSFYCGVLGLNNVARRDFGEGPMVFLSSGKLGPRHRTLCRGGGRGLREPGMCTTSP